MRGDLGAREFIAFWLRDGALAAAMNVNRWDDGDALQALVDKQARVDPQDLFRSNHPIPPARETRGRDAARRPVERVVASG